MTVRKITKKTPNETANCIKGRIEELQAVMAGAEAAHLLEMENLRGLLRSYEVVLEDQRRPVTLEEDDNEPWHPLHPTLDLILREAEFSVVNNTAALLIFLGPLEFSTIFAILSHYHRVGEGKVPRNSVRSALWGEENGPHKRIAKNPDTERYDFTTGLDRERFSEHLIERGYGEAPMS